MLSLVVTLRLAVEKTLCHFPGGSDICQVDSSSRCSYLKELASLRTLHATPSPMKTWTSLWLWAAMKIWCFQTNLLLLLSNTMTREGHQKWPVSVACYEVSVQTASPTKDPEIWGCRHAAATLALLDLKTCC